MPLQLFSTNRTPIAQRATLFRQQMQERFSVGLTIESAGDKPLSTEVSAYCGRSLQFASLRFSAHRTSAAPSIGERSSRLLVTLQDEGTATICQDGRHSDLAPGQFCLIDPARHFSIETTQIRTRSVYLDRPSLLATLPQVDALTARTINGGSGAGAIFRSILDEIFRMAPILDEDTADSIADALPFVLATALQSIKSTLVPSVSRLKLFHKQRIQRYARGSLRDPRLDAAIIARSVNLSPRYISTLFSDEPQSLMKWVWGERLEHCRRDLRDSALAARSISEIAFGWGFSDVAHFSRSFRRRFAVSPREYRKSVLQNE